VNIFYLIFFALWATLYGELYMNMIEVLNLICVSVMLLCVIWVMSRVRVTVLEKVRSVYGRKITNMNFLHILFFAVDIGCFMLAAYVLDINAYASDSIQHKVYIATINILAFFDMFMFFMMYEHKIENKLDEWAERHHLRVRKY
jgi:hypothetical protein